MTILATLLSSFTELHAEGGTIWMYPLTVLFAVNLLTIAYCAYQVIRKRPLESKWLDLIKQLGGLSAAWGAFSTLIGLLYAFGGIEGSPDSIPLNVIAGGVKVALYTVVYGLFILCVSMLSSIVLRLVYRSAVA